MKDRTSIYLWLVFILVVGVRIYLAMQAHGFSDDTAYFNLRQIESIASKGYPDFQDQLSYGGRLFIFLPVFHYVLAFFDLFMPAELVGKILPNIFAACLVFVVFYITYELSKDDKAALLSAFVAGFIPVFFQETLNKLSIYSLAVPAIFLSAFFLIKINSDKKYIIHFIASIFVLSFIHASSFIIIFAMVLYILIVKIQRIKVPTYILELFVFSTFFMIWLEFLLFKKAFLDQGIFLLWQNVPKEIVSQYFASTSIFSALVAIGFIPFLFGLYVAYSHSFKTKDNNVHLLFGFGLGVFLLLWLRLIELELGLIFLGVLLTIGFGVAFSSLMKYIDQTKFSFVKKYAVVVIFVLILVTSVVPSYVDAARTLEHVPTENELKALNWLSTADDGVVLATLKEGHLISAIAGKRNFIDSNFMFIDEIDQRYADLDTMYTSFYTTNTVRLLNKYNIRYIYFSDQAKRRYAITELGYLSDECFEKVYDDEVKIYESLCTLEEE
ncbi:hypothetical protein KY337_00335 [Candidatus Woesearchaeota archaeon]|nr:hypothetical protein [Candidatus Woesearchaeota archaeon]